MRTNPNNLIFSVSEITEYIKMTFDADPMFDSVCICGEISNYKLHSSGHHYMSLKDDNSVINAVMFKSNAAGLKIRLSSGMKIIASGRISVFPKNGQYQLYINKIVPDGIGELYLAFEQLKGKLLAEGLFDEQHKKPLPKYPAKIALVTSAAGAAVHDMIEIITARFPATQIIVCPVTVQGENAAKSISDMIKYVNKHKLCDVIITGRGGGSVEDLWAFNEPEVAYAIHDSKIPVISAVGHEPDFTIADFVADRRAATPSNAAEIVVPDVKDVKFKLENYRLFFNKAITDKIKLQKNKLNNAFRIISSKTAIPDKKRMNLSLLTQKIQSQANMIFSHRKQNFLGTVAKIEAMSPLKVLSRGYSICSKENGEVIRRSSQLQKGEIFNVRLGEGSVSCSMIDVH